MSTFLPAWLTELGQDRSHNEKMACSKPHVFINDAYINSLKRKRTDSYDSFNAPSSSTMNPSAPKQADAPAKKQKEETPAAIHAAPQHPMSVPALPSLPPVVTQPSTLPTSVTVPMNTTQPQTKPILDSLQTSFSPDDNQVQSQDQLQDTQVEEDELSQLMKTMDNSLTKQERAQLKISREIDMEILLKHKELRLIEQELAKCQVSYEQLRRCRIVPFPGQPGATTNPAQIAYQGGVAVEPAKGLGRPQYPAPWSVTDGPYTQHYARWLIPDPAFDPMPTRLSTKSFAGMDSRSSRMGGLDRTSFSASRAHRASANGEFQSLTGNYPVHKKHSPLIVKRPSDGQWVKLVCKFCGKENISSVQGFLNHCRIAHDKNYESHTAAVDDSAQPLGPDEAPPLTTPVNEHPPPLSAISSVASTPTVITAPPMSCFQPVPKIHPLINSSTKPRAAPCTQDAVSTPLRKSGPKTKTSATTKPAVVSPVFQNLDAGSFKAATSTPKLSLLLKKMGVSGDLEKLVSATKEQIDVDEIPYIHAGIHDSSSAVSSPTTTQHTRKPLLSGGRMPAASGQPASKRAKTLAGALLESEPTSPMTPSVTASPHCSRFPSLLSNESLRPSDIDIPDSAMQVDEEFSPHTNPGLLTDRGEDDDDDDSQSRSGSELEHGLSVRIRNDDEHDDSMALDSNPDDSMCLNSRPAPVAGEKRKRGRPSKKDSLLS